jgi:mono/diheme cytochrome c family protein
VTPTTIVIGILALAGILVIAFIIVNANRERRGVNVPPGMRPAYSDEQLERGVLERWMLVGLVLTLFFAVFFPIYWITEDRRLTAQTEERFVSQYVRGEHLYNEACLECHGAGGAGGFTSSPYDPDASWPAPALNDIVARYEENPNVEDIEFFLESTIRHGRPGTPMPPWGAPDGPFTDDEIEALKFWILANQVDEEVAEADPAADMSGEELFQANCAKCHAGDLSGWDSGEGHPAPPLTRVFERHSEESILAILQNGIYVPTHTSMPPWQEGYTYQDARYTDEALQRIIDYLREQQDPDVDEDAPEGEPEDEDDGSLEASAPGGA